MVTPNERNMSRTFRSPWRQWISQIPHQNFRRQRRLASLSRDNLQ